MRRRRMMKMTLLLLINCLPETVAAENHIDQSEEKNLN